MAIPGSGMLLATGVLGSWVGGVLLLGWLAAAVVGTARWHLLGERESRDAPLDGAARRRVLLQALALASAAWACLAAVAARAWIAREAAPLAGAALCGAALLLGFLSLARLRPLGGFARHLVFAASLCASLLAAEGTVMFAYAAAVQG